MHHDNLTDWTHSHSFGQEQTSSAERRTLIVVALTLVTMVVEITAGSIYGSLALLADGVHMGSHAVALGIAAFAYIYARRHAHDQRFSFGTGKVNALGGFTGAVLLAAFALFIAVESIGRFIHPVTIVFDKAIAVAVIGLLVNGVSAWILGGDGHDHGHEHSHSHGEHHESHHHDDHNRRAAYFHVLADALTSVMAIVALLAAKYLGWQWMDPAMGIVGALLITRWSWGLLRDSGRVLLDQQAPDLGAHIKHCLETDEDERVSDLHVWSIGPGIYAAVVALVAHVPKPAAHYRAKLQSDLPTLAHVTVEVQQCTDHDVPYFAVST